MKCYGIFGKYLFEFGCIIGMMQYDLFYIYIVDVYILLVIKNMWCLCYDDQCDEFLVVCEVFYWLFKFELLYVVGFYYDIVKGCGGDYFELGVDDVIVFCQCYGFINWDVKLVVWLVCNYLIMSVIVQCKDIFDLDVVYEFVCIVGDLVYLDYFYVFIVVDINVINLVLWNFWCVLLMCQLYLEIKCVLWCGLNNFQDKQDWIDEICDDVFKLFIECDYDLYVIEVLWVNIGDEYFLCEMFWDIVWYIEVLLECINKEDLLVLICELEISSGNLEGGLQIFIYMLDICNLFVVMVNVLDSFGLIIMDVCIIISVDGFSLDIYIVFDENGMFIGNDWLCIEYICKMFIEMFKQLENFGIIVSCCMLCCYKYFDVFIQVMISNDIVNDCLVVEVYILDWFGLLVYIGCIFVCFELLVQNVCIVILGEKVEDVFFVIDLEGQLVFDLELCQCLQVMFKQELDDYSKIDFMLVII